MSRVPMPGSSADLALRRGEYLQWILDHFGALEERMEPTDARRWALNHGRLMRGEKLDEANRFFRECALTRDADIYFIRYLKTLLDPLASRHLSDEAREHLTGILSAWPQTELTTLARWPVIHTENHQLMQLTINLFAMLQRAEDIADQARQILQTLAWRFERGWVEWNSTCYQVHYANPLILLADHAPDAELRQSAQDLLNVLLSERALLGVGGYLGGPAFRCRTADAEHSLTARKVAYLEDARYDGFLPTVWLAFGLGEPRFDFANARVPGLQPATTLYGSANEPRLKQDEGMFFACSSFEPHPIVAALAEDAATRPFLVYRGRRHLGWPGPEIGETLWETQRWMPGAISYYNTPHVSMGSIHSDGWVCQSRYDQVVFTEDASQGLRVETILPGVPPHKRRYEARGRVVQHQNWLLGQGTLFEDGGIRPRRHEPWDVYRVGRGLCAHYSLRDEYHLLQVSDLDTFPDEEAFVRALSVPRMDGHIVRGATISGDCVEVDVRDMSITVNGTPRPHPPTMLHDCEYMQSEYDSGRITINTSCGSVTFCAPRLA